MTIAVVGAAGRTGRLFVAKALAAGHIVRAGYLVHNPFSAHENLVAMHCDATNRSDVSALLQNCDAVVSTLGHGKHTPPHMQRDAMRVITACMQQFGICRIVSLTGTGARQTGDTITIADRIMTAGMSIWDSARIQDGKDHIAVLQASNLDWTVLRVSKLQNMPARPFSLQIHGPAAFSTSRHEVAAAVLAILETKQFVQQTPMMSRVKI